MRRPSHPGRLIKADLDALKLSVADGASALGVSRAQLNRVVNGSSAVLPEMALRLEAVIGGSADVWLRMQAAFDLAAMRNSEANPASKLKRISPTEEDIDQASPAE